MVSLGKAIIFLLMEAKLINTLFVSVVIQSLKFGSGLSASHKIWITSSQISTRQIDNQIDKKQTGRQKDRQSYKLADKYIDEIDMWNYTFHEKIAYYIIRMLLQKIQVIIKYLDKNQPNAFI